MDPASKLHRGAPKQMAPYPFNHIVREPTTYHAVGRGADMRGAQPEASTSMAQKNHMYNDAQMAHKQQYALAQQNLYYENLDQTSIDPHAVPGETSTE